MRKNLRERERERENKGINREAFRWQIALKFKSPKKESEAWLPVDFNTRYLTYVCTLVAAPWRTWSRIAMVNDRLKLCRQVSH